MGRTSHDKWRCYKPNVFRRPEIERSRLQSHRSRAFFLPPTWVVAGKDATYVGMTTTDSRIVLCRLHHHQLVLRNWLKILEHNLHCLTEFRPFSLCIGL